LKRRNFGTQIASHMAGSNEDQRPAVEEKQGVTVANVIEFYIPNNFRKSVKWVPRELRCKIIEFASQIEKSA
jgi:hypothetical protein